MKLLEPVLIVQKLLIFVIDEKRGSNKEQQEDLKFSSLQTNTCISMNGSMLGC